jgi:hypothetical protein
LQDEAKRAVAECTYSTLVTAGATIGFSLTGPIGASLGSAFGAMLGMEARAAIGYSINDPNLRNQVTAISTFQFLMAGLSIVLALPMGTFVAGLTEIAIEGTGAVEEGWIERWLETAISQGDEGLANFGAKVVGKAEVKEYATNPHFDCSGALELLLTGSSFAQDHEQNWRSY